MGAMVEAAAASDDDAPLAALRLPLGAWLRMLWNVAPPLLHVPGSDAPFLAEAGLHLPAPPPELGTLRARRWYGAAAAHTAAHLVYSQRVFVRAGTAPVTQALIGLLEDARVEALACRELPGLRRLWASLHTATPADGDHFETLLARLARALCDAAYEDPHPWVCKGRALFGRDGDGGGDRLADTEPTRLRALASALGHDIGQMRRAFNPRLYRPDPSYRDDNRWLWQDGAGEQAGRLRAAPATGRRQAEGRVDDAPPAPLQWRYPEWDHRIGRLRPAWCTVHERHPESVARPPGPDADPADPVVPVDAADGALQRRLAVLLKKTAMQARSLRRREDDGDDIDLDEAVRAVLSLRAGGAHGERFHRRVVRKPQACSAVLLIDSSASSARPHGADGLGTQLWTQQQVAAAWAGAMTAAGWSFAIQGFDSDGRHGVNHWRVKDFGEPWDAPAKARLAGLRAGLSTRVGAAVRHAAAQLAARPAAKRTVIMMSDGEPHDVDIHDPRYLIEDARQAVQAARAAGVECLGLLLDPVGAASALRIFGAGRSVLLEDASMLPSATMRLFAR